MDSNTYTTGQMIDLIQKDKELIFEAVSGMYDGSIIAFHDDMQWLMWLDDSINTYLPITLNAEFMKTKWKLLSNVYVLKIDCPLVKCGRSYSVV